MKIISRLHSSVLPRIVIVAAVLLTFGQALSFGPIAISDDHTNILAHHHSFWRIWREAYEGLYIPLPYTLWTMLWKFGAGAAAYHGLGLGLHALSALMVFKIFSRFYPTGALLGALFWALHPLMVEPVVWMTGLKDTLSGCLVLVAIVCHLDGRKWRAGALAALAVLAKPTAGIAGLLAVVLLPSWGALTFLPAAIMAPFGTLAQQGQGPDYHFGVRVFNALDSVGHYLLAGPSADHWNLGIVESHSFVIWGVVTIVLAWWSKGLRFYLAALLPVLGLVSFSFQNWSNTADRYAYLPLVGAALAVAALVEKVLKLWQTDKYGAALYGVPMLIVLFAMARAAQDRVPYWRNAQTLYHHEVYVCTPTRASEKKADCAYFVKPNSFMILGLLARESGDETMANIYFDEAKDANDWKQGLLKEALANPILWWTGGLAGYGGLAGFQREMARREMERAKSWPPSP